MLISLRMTWKSRKSNHLSGWLSLTTTGGNKAEPDNVVSLVNVSVNIKYYIHHITHTLTITHFHNLALYQDKVKE